MADPQIVIPWPAEYAMPRTDKVESIHVSIPYHIQPRSVEAYADAWAHDDQSRPTPTRPIDDVRHDCGIATDVHSGALRGRPTAESRTNQTTAHVTAA